MVYYLPLALFHDIPKGNFVGVVKDLLIVSYTRYWFFRDYLFLFLFALVVNKYLHEITPRQRVYLLSILSFMAIWVGTSRGYEPLAGGKNLTNFILLYVVGDTLRAYHDLWSRISTKKLISIFIAINTIELTAWLYSYDSLMSKFIWAISFPYCSPLLYLNAILVFMIFGKLNFKSKVVNTIALSVFSVFIIHCHPVISEQCIRPVANVILNICNNNPLAVIPLYFVFTIVIFVACTLIDQVFQPLWQYAGKKTAAFEAHLKQSKLK